MAADGAEGIPIPPGCVQWVHKVHSDFAGAVKSAVKQLKTLDNGTVKQLKHQAANLKLARKAQADNRAELQRLPAEQCRSQRQRKAHARLCSSRLERADKAAQRALKSIESLVKVAVVRRREQADMAVALLAGKSDKIISSHMCNCLPASARGDEEQQGQLRAALQCMAVGAVMSGMEVAQQFIETEYSSALRDVCSEGVE